MCWINSLTKMLLSNMCSDYISVEYSESLFRIHTKINKFIDAFGYGYVFISFCKKWLLCILVIGLHRDKMLSYWWLYFDCTLHSSKVCWDSTGKFFFCIICAGSWTPHWLGLLHGLHIPGLSSSTASVHVPGYSKNWRALKSEYSPGKAQSLFG